MNFSFGLPHTRNNHNGIWIIVDRLKKISHFLPIQEDSPLHKMDKNYVNEVFRLHGSMMSINSHQYPHFKSKFWSSLQVVIATRLKFSTAFHP